TQILTKGNKKRRKLTCGAFCFVNEYKFKPCQLHYTSISRKRKQKKAKKSEKKQKILKIR
ncbi:hypothetical protein, partial [Mycoplasmopsis bovis]|uniref:hypothetical protein n=1 Tax=Mycoplasmopsis bovis TaxID=28903 RepID=UPI003F7B346B